MVHFLTDSNGNLSFAAVNTDLVNDTTPQLGGDLDTNGNDINFAANNGAVFAGDLTISHTGDHGNIVNTDGNLNIKSQGTISLFPANNNDGIVIVNGGAVSLYHNNVKRFETTANGVEVSAGRLDVGSVSLSGGGLALADNDKVIAGSNDDIQIYHDSSANKNIIETTAGGNLDIGSTHNADVQIKTNSVNRYNFGAGGFVPLADNSYDLGSTSNRWRNIYTNDLNLSNEGHGNDVDGTWGSYTIQEGADDLFLINKRTGKKYKFNLTEVS